MHDYKLATMYLVSYNVKKEGNGVTLASHCRKYRNIIRITDIEKYWQTLRKKQI
jgi:hypothetical protein